MPAVTTTHQVGHLEKDGKAFQDYVKRYLVNASDFSGGVFRLPIPRGATVIGVRVRVVTAFNGTSPALTVGDGSLSNGYLASGNVDPAVANAYANSAGLGTNAYAVGRHYANGGFVLLTITGSPTVGQLEVGVCFDGYEAPTRDMIANY